MAAFYWERLWTAARALMRGAGHFYTLPLLVAAVLVFFNPEIAQSVSDWDGVSRWWAALILGGLVLYAVAHGHYERTVARDQRIEALSASLDAVAQSQAPASFTGISQQGSGSMTIGQSRMIQDTGASDQPRELVLEVEELAARSEAAGAAIGAFYSEREASEPDFLTSEGMEERSAHGRETLRLYRKRFAPEVLFLAEELVARGTVRKAYELDVHMPMQLAEIATQLGAAAHRLRGAEASRD